MQKRQRQTGGVGRSAGYGKQNGRGFSAKRRRDTVFLLLSLKKKAEAVRAARGFDLVTWGLHAGRLPLRWLGLGDREVGAA